MTSDENSLIKDRFFDEHFKAIAKNSKINQQLAPKQPSLRNPSILPPISRLSTLAAAKTSGSFDSGKSSTTYAAINRELSRRSLARQHFPSFSSRSQLSQMANNALSKRATRYDHITSKIDTGIPRLDNPHRNELDHHPLKPSRPIPWSYLRQELEQDIQIRAQAKRIQFNTGVTYTNQLTTLSNLIRSKVKTHIASMMNPNEERYKIVVQLHVFPMNTSGLHIASRCLWNTLTDNSITLRMQGVDCNLLIVVFLCYTDLGTA